MTATAMIVESAAAQLVAETTAAVEALRVVSTVLGPEPARLNLVGWAPTLARCTDLTTALAHGDPPAAHRTAELVLAACWPPGITPPPEWWNTPLGRLVARWVNPGTGSVTYDEAARMLGVSRGTVSQMVHRGVHGKGGSGGLERHPDGGVTRASVLARIARLSRTP